MNTHWEENVDENWLWGRGDTAKVVQVHVWFTGGGTRQYTWTCLECAETFTVKLEDENAVNASVSEHHPLCEGDRIDGCARMRLLDLMSGWSESMWAAGWISGLTGELLREGEPWTMLFERYGVPLGLYGRDGWVTLEEAKRVEVRAVSAAENETDRT